MPEDAVSALKNFFRALLRVYTVNHNNTLITNMIADYLQCRGGGGGGGGHRHGCECGPGL